MMTDPIADMLTRIRNAVRVERPFVEMPLSSVRGRMLLLMCLRMFDAAVRQPAAMHIFAILFAWYVCM